MIKNKLPVNGTVRKAFSLSPEEIQIIEADVQRSYAPVEVTDELGNI